MKEKKECVMGSNSSSIASEWNNVVTLILQEAKDKFNSLFLNEK